jgi:hypothetical protein
MIFRRNYFMSKLYAVTCGEYSDYHIVALCSDKTKAEEIVELLSRDEPCYEPIVEEYEDGICFNLNRNMYFVCLDENGLDVELLDNYEKLETLRDEELNKVEYIPYFKRYRVKVEANNEEIAKKIACDLIAEFKAKQEGPLFKFLTEGSLQNTKGI